MAKEKMAAEVCTLWLTNGDVFGFPSLVLIGSSIGYSMIVSKTPLIA